MSKFQIDDTVNIGGSLKVTGVQRHKTGTFFYNVNFGGDNITLTERAILQMQSTGIRANPFCAETITKQEDKPKYKSGDKVKVIGNCCAHHYDKGTVLTLVSSQDFLRDTPDWYVAEGKDYVAERDIEPYTEPEHPKEPIVLYCVKSHLGVCVLIKDKIYEFVCGNSFPYEDSDSEDLKYDSFEEYSKSNPTLSACLIKTEKRPAKKGEYILVTKSMDTRVKTGDVYKFIGGGSFDEDIFVEHPKGKRMKDGAADISPSEYLVLPDYTPEKVEPTYYSGKVVCVEANSRFFTAGKTYEFKDGKVCTDDRRYLPEHSPAVKTLSEFMETKNIMSKFIPYLGEQSC